MPRRLFLALILLVAAPMVLLGWMSASAVKSSQAAAKESLTRLLSRQLEDANVKIVQLFDSYAQQLNRELQSDADIVESLRRMRREMPVVRQGILVDKRGFLLFPSADDVVGVDANAVAASLPGLVDARPFSNSDVDSDQADARDKKTQSESGKQMLRSAPTTKSLSKDDERVNAKAEPEKSGWQQWYMAGGAQVIYWRELSDGSSAGVLLERSRWIADLIAVLPNHQPVLSTSLSEYLRGMSSENTGGDRPGKQLTSGRTAIGSISLVDESKRAIYRWGDPDEFRLAPLVASELSMPLASWQLRLHVDPSVIPAESTLPLYLSLGSVAILLLSTGFYVLTSVHRQISDAKNRVTFAGQVSHELRTPLTNIRLYTELAESDVEKMEPSPSAQSLLSRLEVIDHESRRLQRLVSGVLEMIRPSGRRSGPRIQRTDVNDLIDGIVQQFMPSFKAAGLSIESQCCDALSVSIDPDIVEMVLVNLLSNVEKYVPGGGRCRIEATKDSSATLGTCLKVLVEDDGPGVGSIHRRKVFRPFERLDDSINAPSGTGIGLTIARRAAERHGGRLELCSKSTLGGAAFELLIPIEVSDKRDS